MICAAESGGNVTSIRPASTTASHTNTGILFKVIPGQRIENAVAMRLIAVAVEPTLASRMLSILDDRCARSPSALLGSQPPKEAVLQLDRNYAAPRWHQLDITRSLRGVHTGGAASFAYLRSRGA